jgi:hypothetical protein
MSYTFYHQSDVTGIEILAQTPDDDTTWMELTDKYVHFLRTCGFVLDEKVFETYLRERISEDEDFSDY